MFSVFYDIRHFQQDLGKIDNTYSGYAWFSDWSDVECNYATNSIVAGFYHYKDGDAITIGPYWYRRGRLDTFNRDERPEVIIGIDYYGLTGVCAGLLPSKWLSRNRQDLMNGKVKILYCKKQLDGLYFKETQH